MLLSYLLIKTVVAKYSQSTFSLHRIRLQLHKKNNQPYVKIPMWEPQTYEKFRVPWIYFIHPVRRRKIHWL